MATNSGNPVVDAIDSLVANQRVRLAMLMGAHMESGWNRTAVGDHGNSFGPFQINAPTHPGVSVAQAEDPSWAVRYMLGPYTGGVAHVPDSLWSSDPKHAAALAAFYAERPKDMYGQRAIDSAWTDVQRIGTGTLPAGGTGAPVAGSAPATTTPGTGLESFSNPLTDVAKSARAVAITAVFALGGIGLVAMGAWRSTARTTGDS
jgi:hypothetical protein